jgi:hypothetical protein
VRSPVTTSGLGSCGSASMCPSCLVPGAGIEPARPLWSPGILSPVRLPVSPPRLACRLIITETRGGSSRWDDLASRFGTEVLPRPRRAVGAGEGRDLADSVNEDNRCGAEAGPSFAATPSCNLRGSQTSPLESGGAHTLKAGGRVDRLEGVFLDICTGSTYLSHRAVVVRCDHRGPHR